MRNKKINFAIVGLGNIGKRHARHILKNKEAQLAAVCDIESTAFSDELFQNGIKRYQSLERVLLNNDIDVVNICTPNYLHHPMTIKALEAGKHVVCEKPMALTSAHCEEMINTAAENNCQIFVVKQNRYNAPVREVKKLIRAGALGKIFQVNINCFWNRNEAYYRNSNWRGKKDKDGGCLFTQFSHFVDIMYYLFGEAKCTAGRVCNFGHQQLIEFEDTGIFHLKTSQGTLISFNFTTCSYQKNMEGSFTIIAEKGSVKIGGEYLNRVDYQEIEGRRIPDLTKDGICNDYGTYKGSMSNHDKMIQNVIDTIKGKARAKTSVDDGMKVVEIIEQMYKATQIKQVMLV